MGWACALLSVRCRDRRSPTTRHGSHFIFEPLNKLGAAQERQQKTGPTQAGWPSPIARIRTPQMCNNLKAGKAKEAACKPSSTPPKQARNSYGAPAPKFHPLPNTLGRCRRPYLFLLRAQLRSHPASPLIASRNFFFFKFTNRVPHRFARFQLPRPPALSFFSFSHTLGRGVGGGVGWGCRSIKAVSNSGFSSPSTWVASKLRGSHSSSPLLFQEIFKTISTRGGVKSREGEDLWVGWGGRGTHAPSPLQTKI